MRSSGSPADKDALRLRLTAARAARGPAGLADAGANLAAAAAALPTSRRVAAYVGVGTEPPTAQLLEALRAGGAEVLLPVVLPDGLLEWGRLPDHVGLLERGPLGLLEPPPPYLGPDVVAGADLVLVPALAVDRRGNRLGRGRGYYDRALALLPDDVRVLAVVFEDEVLDEVPVEPHDRPVCGALLPSGLVMFTR
jgi:5-formyltetrahydrofolate cyclo-ligase